MQVQIVFLTSAPRWVGGLKHYKEKENANTCEFREVGGYMRVHDLLLEDVGLVEEEYDGGALEPGISYDGFEQSLALLHTVLKSELQQIKRQQMKI